MKTTLDLPDELIREVKLRAVMLRRPLSDLVAEFLRQGLGVAPGGDGERRTPSLMVGIGEGGLPVIHRAPEAPAKRADVAELLRLEQETQAEEDLRRAGLRC